MDTESNEKLTKKERKMLRREEKNREKERMERNKKSSRLMTWFAVLLVIGGGIAGVYFLSSSGEKNESGSVSGGEIDESLAVISADDRIKGNKESEVILIEYGDFQCPACGSYYPLLKELSANFADNTLFAYRHFPLKEIHKNAEAAAWAAEASGRQDKFWEMHDLLFENQKDWSGDGSPEDKFEEYAESLGLNMEQFNKDMESSDAREKVESDYQGGLRSRVDSTPTFFLNGQKIANPKSYDDFKRVIEQEISKLSEAESSEAENSVGNATSTEGEDEESEQGSE